MRKKRHQNPVLPFELITPEESQETKKLGAAPQKITRELPQTPAGDTPAKKIYDKLVRGLNQFFKKNEKKRAVLGLSGGVDSALTLKIAVDALGAENVTALIMPEQGITNPENTIHARGLAEFLSVHTETIPINRLLTDFSLLPWRPNDVALANTKSRIRALLLYSYANTHSACVLGTSNKSELLLGYFTKFGDGAVDVEVIGDLFKTEVWVIADDIGIPPEIIEKKPSAELSMNQTDEKDLGADYKKIDTVLMQIHLGRDKLIDKGLDPVLVHNIFNRIEKNAHKTKLPPILKAR